MQRYRDVCELISSRMEALCEYSWSGGGGGGVLSIMEEFWERENEYLATWGLTSSTNQGPLGLAFHRLLVASNPLVTLRDTDFAHLKTATLETSIFIYSPSISAISWGRGWECCPGKMLNSDSRYFLLLYCCPHCYKHYMSLYHSQEPSHLSHLRSLA